MRFFYTYQGHKHYLTHIEENNNIIVYYNDREVASTNDNSIDLQFILLDYIQKENMSLDFLNDFYYFSLGIKHKDFKAVLTLFQLEYLDEIELLCTMGDNHPIFQYNKGRILTGFINYNYNPIYVTSSINSYIYIYCKNENVLHKFAELLGISKTNYRTYLSNSVGIIPNYYVPEIYGWKAINKGARFITYKLLRDVSSRYRPR